MHIAMMTAWNTDSGVAVHAEPLGKAWKEMGHDVTIFTHTLDDFHGGGLTREDDENYVIRCFGTQKTDFLDPRPIFTTDFDVLVVQDLRMMPVKSLAEIFPLIKHRARTVHVVHENQLPPEPWFYQFDWDGVVYFDDKQGFLNDVYPHARLIPFPCFPTRTRDKNETRKKLNLPLDKRIICTFCHRGYEPFLRDLRKDIKKETVLLYVVPPDYQMVEKDEPPPWMIIREEGVLSEERFDDYLFASDCLILHKFKSLYLGVVSSTAFQALGAGCPILVPQGSDYFTPLKNELLHYNDVSDLNRMLVELFRNEEMRKNVLDAANGFVAMNSPEIIAKLFIDFFIKLGRPG